jgi:DNA-binding transcriptional ArsR family regulator
MDKNEQPELFFDLGTAYDMFFSLHVLHHPEDYGLRGSWAAGVRSRIPAEERKILESAELVLHVPVTWIHSLPSPKDGATVLWALGQLSPAERLPAMWLNPGMPCEADEIFQEVASKGSWSEGDFESYKSATKSKGEKKPKPKVLRESLEWWSRSEEFGEKILPALQSYQQVFFAEEELRIRPALKESITRAKEMAEQMAVKGLLEKLSQGVSSTEWQSFKEIALAPSFWITPFIIYSEVSDQRMVFIYGARPDDASLVPGEMVPDAILRALKAMADPTRMKILRYLAVEPHTPAQLSRKLRLRAPTVIHHLNALRLAGLVHLTVEAGGERRYAMRTGMVKDTCDNLQDFLLKPLSDA